MTHAIYAGYISKCLVSGYQSPFHHHHSTQQQTEVYFKPHDNSNDYTMLYHVPFIVHDSYSQDTLKIPPFNKAA